MNEVDMNTQHTPEPWQVFPMVGNVCGVQKAHGNNSDICHIQEKFDSFRQTGTALANAHRIVACVNACAGLTDDELQEFGNCGIKHWINDADETLKAVCVALLDVDYLGRCEHGIYALKQQLSELQAKCDGLVKREIELTHIANDNFVIVNKLQAQCVGFEKDALRYRFIRDADVSDNLIPYAFSYAMETLDQYIDEAMECAITAAQEGGE